MSDDDNTRSIPQRPDTRAMPGHPSKPGQPSSNLPEPAPRPYPGQSAAPSAPPVQYAPPAQQQGYGGQQHQGYQNPQGYGGPPVNGYGQPPVNHPQQPAYGPSYSSTTTLVRPAPNGALVVVAWIVAVFTFLYMLPWAVAATRGKSNQGAIGLLNFFLGWSFIGWVVALVMACSSEPQPVVMIQQNHQYGPGYHR